MSQQMLPLIGDGYTVFASDLSGSSNAYGPESTEKELHNYLLTSPVERFHVKSATGDQTSWKSLARHLLYWARVAQSHFCLPLHCPVSCRSTSSSPLAIRLNSGDWKHVKDQNFSGFVRKALDSCLDYDSLSFPIPGSTIEEEELTFCLKETLVGIFPRSCESSVLRLLAGAQSRHAIFHENIVVKTFYEAEKAHEGQNEKLRNLVGEALELGLRSCHWGWRAWSSERAPWRSWELGEGRSRGTRSPELGTLAGRAGDLGGARKIGWRSGAPWPTELAGAKWLMERLKLIGEEKSREI
ncbi:hypothetical protein KSP40_PGU017953 [Platanthera guangdongensis]|uniref:Uncharacterized protein n=1 Tax=Platanthera guangdongensis TaxID=2320717 RepID=A0ABR2LEH3_9ASPA